MLKMMIHMRRYAWMLAAVVALLAAQAACELWLPTYTAAIVDVGIQQEGVESPVPEAVRESALEEMLSGMDSGDASRVRAAYVPADEAALSRLGVTERAEPVLVLGADPGPLEDAFSGLYGAQAGSGARQAAIAAAGAEYAALGMDLRGMQRRAIFKYGAMMFLIALAAAAAAAAVGYLGSRAAAGMGRDLRQRVYERVMGFGQKEMDGFSTASLITRSTNDIQQVQNVMVLLLRIAIYAPILGVGGVVRALETNASMAWVIAVGVGLVLAVVGVLFALGLPRFKRMQVEIDRVNLVMRETLTGLSVIRAFVTQGREQERFDQASGALRKTQRFVGRLMGGMMPMMMLAMNGVCVLILWVGAGSISQGRMQVGDMMAFIQYTMQIIAAFLMISLISVMLPRASVSAKRIQEVLDTQPSVKSPQSPAPFDPAQAGTVRFEDVSFRYPGADEDTLSHISFTARPGRTTAILGGTGSGKSTLLSLIPRFYDVTGGRVVVDGVDVRSADLEGLRARIGYVPQKAVLFSGTVRENIAFGSGGMEAERVERAAQVAQAGDFILEREGGYDSQIAQGGANVSGGQKQRLSIARAVARKPEIYLFDDSFSALDFRTDAAVRRALGEEAAGATVIVVAQRIATVMHADEILVLDEGRLAGRGTHARLMEECEVYRQIAVSQLSKEELAHGTK